MAGAQQAEGLQTIRFPLYDKERARLGGQAAWQDNDQVLVNCFPVVNKNPIQDDGGEVTILTRPGFQNPDTTITNLDTVLPVATYNLISVVATLGIVFPGISNDMIITAYWGWDSSIPAYVLKIISYIPNTASGATLIGQINTSSYGVTTQPSVHLSQISNGASQLGIAVTFHPKDYNQSTTSNSDCYYSLYTAGVWGALTAIADVDFPTNTPAKGIVGPLVQLNNVHYIMTVDGYIYGSYPSLTFPFNPDIATWNAQGNISAQAAMDGGAGLYRYKHHLLAFGQNSCEFFNDEGLAQPNLPIRRTQQAFFKVGLVNATAITEIDDDVYFIGVSKDSAHIGLYKLSGYTITLISSLAAGASFLNRAYYQADLQVYSFAGTRHIITNIWKEASYTSAWSDETRPENDDCKGVMVYCLDSKAWWILVVDPITSDIDRGPPLFLTVKTPGSGIGANQWIYICGSQVGNGPIDHRFNYSYTPNLNFSYEHVSTTETYDSLRRGLTEGPVVVDHFTIPVLISTNSTDFGISDRKTISKIKIVMDYPRTVDSVSDPIMTWYDTLSDKLQLSVYKDKDATPEDSTNTFTPQYRILDLKTADPYSKLTYYNFGTARDWKFIITYSGWNKLRIRGLDITVKAASH